MVYNSVFSYKYTTFGPYSRTTSCTAPSPCGQAQDLTLQRGGEMNTPGALSAFWLAFSNFSNFVLLS